jgi:hypothetical protein
MVTVPSLEDTHVPCDGRCTCEASSDLPSCREPQGSGCGFSTADMIGACPVALPLHSAAMVSVHSAWVLCLLCVHNNCGFNNAEIDCSWCGVSQTWMCCKWGASRTSTADHRHMTNCLYRSVHQTCLVQVDLGPVRVVPSRPGVAQPALYVQVLLVMLPYSPVWRWYPTGAAGAVASTAALALRSCCIC